MKVKRRPGPTIGAPQELVYGESMHHAHNCSVAKFNPKGSGNQNNDSLGRFTIDLENDLSTQLGIDPQNLDKTSQ